MASPIRLAVRTRSDVERARRVARSFAAGVGFAGIDIEQFVLVVSELATNLVRYAENGELTLRAARDFAEGGVAVESRDTGPGIADLAAALQDGISTGGGLGGGLPSVRRLMDTVNITTGADGTTIVACKFPAQ